jgi:hypothetical protein
MREVPEAMKPRRIEIRAGTTAQTNKPKPSKTLELRHNAGPSIDNRGGLGPISPEPPPLKEGGDYASQTKKGRSDAVIDMTASPSFERQAGDAANHFRGARGTRLQTISRHRIVPTVPETPSSIGRD